MRTRVVKIIFVLAVLPLALAACGSGRPARSPYPPVTPVVKKTMPPAQPEAKAKDDTEAFNILTVKMDEYQDLSEACDRLARTDQNREMRDSCIMRLKALLRELVDLTNLVNGPPD